MDMSSLWIRKWMLAAALAVMPLHGIAATLTVLLCHGEAQAHATHAAGDHDGHQHEATHQHQHGSAGSDDGSTGGASSFHLCCNLTASAPPAISLVTELPDFPVQAFAPDPLQDLYFPDQPQRPPLA
jgi:ABC-type Zn2+ transport system substrate-binding protein/surface adhesin